MSYNLTGTTLKYDDTFVQSFDQPPCKIRICEEEEEEVNRDITLVVNKPCTKCARAAVMIRMVDVGYNEYQYHTELNDEAHFFKDGKHSFSLTRKPYHDLWPSKNYMDIPLIAAWTHCSEIMIFSWATYGIGLFDADTGIPMCMIDTFDVLSNHTLVNGFLSVTHSNIYFHGKTQFLLKIDDWVASANSGYKGNVTENANDIVENEKVSERVGDIDIYQGKGIDGMTYLQDGSPWEIDENYPGMLIFAPVKSLRDVIYKRFAVEDVYENSESYESLFNDIIVSTEYHDLVHNGKHQSFLHEICSHPDIIFEDDSRAAVAYLLNPNLNSPLFIEPRCIGNSSGESLYCHAKRLLGWKHGSYFVKQLDHSLNMLIPQSLFDYRRGCLLSGISKINLTFTFNYREMHSTTNKIKGGFKMVVEQNMKLVEDKKNAYEVDPCEPCFVKIIAV